MVSTRAQTRTGVQTETTNTATKPSQKVKPGNFTGAGEKVGAEKKKPGPKAEPPKVTTSDQPLSPSKPLNAPQPDYSLKNAKATPKKAVTKVRGPGPDEKPVKNIYGEDQMDSSNDQRLEQCIIFLSDEGPENHPHFKDKLRKIEHEIGSVWPARKRREAHLKDEDEEKKFNYDKKLHTKVMNMVAVHRARLEAGAKVWFEQTMFPQFPVSESDEELQYPLPPLKAVPAKKTKQDKLAYAALAREKEREKIAAFAKNPWPEKMPRAEVWHRKMPARFPFGDTPAMELAMSRQISKDLGEDKVSAGTWLKSLFGTTYDFIRGAPLPQSTWALPIVSQADIHKLTATLAALEAEEKKAAGAAIVKKRAAKQAAKQAEKEAAKDAAARQTPGAASEQFNKRKDPFQSFERSPSGTIKKPRLGGIGPEGRATLIWE